MNESSAWAEFREEVWSISHYGASYVPTRVHRSISAPNRFRNHSQCNFLKKSERGEKFSK